MSDKIWSAVIATLVAVIIFVLRDVALPYISRIREKSDIKIGIYEQYSMSIAFSAVSLFYRLREIIIDGRSSFLINSERGTRFSDYKFSSTIYRICCVLGWIRALKKEQSYLLLYDNEQNARLSEKISKFESALADGPHVETDILNKLCELWGFSEKIRNTDTSKHAARLDVLRTKYLSLIESGTLSRKDYTEEQRVNIIKEVHKQMCSILNVKPITEERIHRRVEDAFHILQPTQAWLYRDWQSAVGDMMLVEISNANRRFSVIGYREFEELFDGKNKWVQKVIDIFDGVDFVVEDLNDYRRSQIEQILRGMAEIIIEIEKIKLPVKVISLKTLEHAQSVLKQLD